MLPSNIYWGSKSVVGQGSTVFNVYTKPLRSYLATTSVILGFCIFSKLPDEASAAGPQTIL